MFTKEFIKDEMLSPCKCNINTTLLIGDPLGNNICRQCESFSVLYASQNISPYGLPNTLFTLHHYISSRIYEL